MANWGKQPSSRILNYQPLTWTGSGTLVSTTFGAQTYQVRVAASVPIWISIGTSSSTVTGATIPTTLGATGTLINANTVGEYFAVTPGEILLCSSTSSSTTVSNVFSVTEMT